MHFSYIDYFFYKKFIFNKLSINEIFLRYRTDTSL
jgi:hypothetical protein